MALINGPADATAAGYAGGMGIQGIIKLIQMLRKKKGFAGQRGPNESLGATNPMDSILAQQRKGAFGGATPADTNPMTELPFGREDRMGNLTSQFLPPGEGATPEDDKMQQIMAMLPLLKQMGSTGRGF